MEHLAYLAEDFLDEKKYKRYSVLCVENGEEFRVIEKADTEEEAFLMTVDDASVYGGKAVRVLGIA